MPSHMRQDHSTDKDPPRNLGHKKSARCERLGFGFAT